MIRFNISKLRQHFKIFCHTSNNIKDLSLLKMSWRGTTLYTKLKLLLIYSFSRKPKLFSASYSDLKYPKGVTNTEGVLTLRGETCFVDLLSRSSSVQQYYWHYLEINWNSWNFTIYEDFEIFGLFYLFFTCASSRGAFAPITVMPKQLDLTEMSTNIEDNQWHNQFLKKIFNVNV